jgi:hypothetical protein
MFKFKSIISFLVSFTLFICLFANSNTVLAHGAGIHLLDGENIITSPIDLRISLWSSYQVNDGDIDANGDINTSAEHYGGYQNVLSIDNTHDFFDDEDGYHKIDTDYFTDFPETPTQNSMFLQVEYKYQSDPNTSYQVYDFVNDPPWENITRYLLVDNVSYVSADAGPGTNNNTFTLDDNNNAGTAITLEFGCLLSETLSWSIANARFELSDDLNITGGLSASGGIDFSMATSFMNRVETSTPATCVEGEQYYDSTENVLKICTDTNTWSTVSFVQ